MNRIQRATCEAPTALPANWRDRLPPASNYYTRHIEKLGKPNGEGWAQGRCPLHVDRHNSLSVKVDSARGAWRCFAGCGAGDIVSFHSRLKGLAFGAAVRDLLSETWT